MLIDKILDKELQSLKLPSGERVVYTGEKGQRVADSDVNKSKTLESFALTHTSGYLTSKSK
jgi:hypothetical protein